MLVRSDVMNRKGFTLIELLTILVIITIISFVIIHNVYSTWSASKEETYKIMKNNTLLFGDYIR